MEKKKETKYPRAYHGTVEVAGSDERHREAGLKDLQVKF